MKNLIKELYYGNIDPQARGFKNGSYLKKQITILSESEALLTDKLTGDEQIKEDAFFRRIDRAALRLLYLESVQALQP